MSNAIRVVILAPFVFASALAHEGNGQKHRAITNSTGYLEDSV